MASLTAIAIPLSLSLLVLFLFFPPLPAICPFGPCGKAHSTAAAEPAHSPSKAFFLPPPPPRSSPVIHQVDSPPFVCSLKFQGKSERKVLQLNGTADDVVYFTLCPSDAPINGLQLADFSSDLDILAVQNANPSDVQLDRVVSDISRCQNITATFSFDRMVGKVDYRLSVRESPSSDPICSVQLSFIVIGFTVYEERDAQPSPEVTTLTSSSSFAISAQSAKTKVVLSGEGNEVISDYRDNLVQRLKAFKFKIQFSDGTDSCTRPPHFIAAALKNMKTNTHSDATSPVKFEDKNCDIVKPLALLETSSCGLAISIPEEDVTCTDLALGLKYESYRDGLSTFLFEWDFLTRDDPEVSGEQFVNVLYVSVIGDAPPIVLDMQPRTKFRRAGGEVLLLVMDNTEGSTSRILRVGDTSFPEVEGSYQQRASGLYEAMYITQPGNGTLLEWHLYVSFPEGTTRRAKLVGLNVPGKMSYADAMLSITSMQPAVGKEGDHISLTGYFDGFDSENPDHNVLFGQKPLRSLQIVPAVNKEGNVLHFKVPKRAVIGASYDYPVQVVMNNESSASFTFSYIPDIMMMNVSVYGASYNEELDRHEIGGCAISRFVASFPSGVSEPDSFLWRVVDLKDQARKNLLDGLETISNAKSLLLMPNVFQGKEGNFEVTVTSVVNEETLTSSVAVTKALSPIIGVTLLRPQPRSISLPDVPLRVSAIVIPPRSECYNQSSKIVYRWSYQGVTQEFSYRNFSSSPLNESSMPSRLGREYVIPQSSLVIGNTSVSLVAFMEEDHSTSGRATTSLSIFPSQLVPVIGYGASKMLHSIARDLIMTAEKSYNPDGKYLGDASNINVFLWECKVSHYVFNETNATSCDTGLLPDKHAASFTVTMESLARLRNEIATNGDSVSFSIQYSLRVGVNSFMSSQRFQIIEISSDDFAVAKLEGLRVLDNRGNVVDWLHVQSFDDILVVPEGDDVSWSFSVVSPPASTLMLREPGNLILHPGYFDPTLPGLYQVLPLGVKGGVLAHAQEYELLISISSTKPSVERGEARFILQTQDKPMLVLPDLPIIFGDSETVFSAYAQVNLDATHDFLYFFYLVAEDGEDYCLDGCGGRPFVQFRLTEAGTYRILVRLMDIQGRALLNETFFERTVTMSSASFEVSALSSGTQIGDFDSMLRNIHYQGDHGTFELLASSLASRAKKDGVYASSEGDAMVLDLAVNAMHQIVQNSAPTTMTSKSYVKTACRLASMDAEFFESQETMYTIFSMVDKAVTHVPMNEAFDIEKELLSFYNVSAKHVINALASSSTRVRLQQFGSDSGLDSRSLLVDLYRLQEEHLTMVLARDAQCGMVRHLSTIVSDGMPPAEINNFVVNTRTLRTRKATEPTFFNILSEYESRIHQPSHSSFTLAVLCNPDQAKGIRGEATSFRWCDDVFSMSGVAGKAGAYTLDPNHKRLFSIMETLDYVWLSGLGGDDSRSDTNFLVTTNVTALGDDGLSLLPLPEISNCYSVNTSMVRLGVTPVRGCLSAEGYMVQELGRPFEPKVLKRDLRKNFTAVESALSYDRSSTILLRFSRPGVLGASGQDCPVSARKPTLALPDGEDTRYVYVVFGALCIALVMLMVTWVGTSYAYSSHLASTPA